MITLTRQGPTKQNPEVFFVVKRGVTFLAVISFDGPRNTIITHQGSLYSDERKEAYRLHQLMKA